VDGEATGVVWTTIICFVLALSFVAALFFFLAAKEESHRRHGAQACLVTGCGCAMAILALLLLASLGGCL
jgi:hypothetical protein